MSASASATTVQCTNYTAVLDGVRGVLDEFVFARSMAWVDALGCAYSHPAFITIPRSDWFISSARDGPYTEASNAVFP